MPPSAPPTYDPTVANRSVLLGGPDTGPQPPSKRYTRPWVPTANVCEMARKEGPPTIAIGLVQFPVLNSNKVLSETMSALTLKSRPAPVAARAGATAAQPPSDCAVHTTVTVP